MTNNTGNNPIDGTHTLLHDIKEMVMTPEIDDFDQMLLIELRGAYAMLQHTSGVPSYKIDSTTITENIHEDAYIAEMIEQYLINSVRLNFDPPNNEYTVRALKERVVELQWRIRSAIEHPDAKEAA